MNESCPESLCGKTFRKSSFFLSCVWLCVAVQRFRWLCNCAQQWATWWKLLTSFGMFTLKTFCWTAASTTHILLTILDIFMEPSETLATNQPAEWNNCLSWLTDDIETEVKRFVFWVCLSGSTVLCFPWLDAIKDIRLPLVLAAGTSLPTTAATRHQCVMLQCS